MKVSLRDISAQTGFSPATISNALNHKRGVNKETAAEVFRVAKEMGYLEERIATKIKLVIFRKNGSIIEDTPFFPTLISGFEQECRGCGYEMMIYNLDQQALDYERQVETLKNDTGSAIVILATEMSDKDLELFKGAGCPVVILDYWSEKMDFNGVLINNSDSARMAVEYLIAKGHKTIGYLRGSYRIKGFRSRYTGYIGTMRKNKLEVAEEQIVTLSTTLNGAYQDMLIYLETKPTLPTAFFADNDMIALGAMKALTQKGYNIPEDVSLIGFDDLPYSEISSPRLTTIRVPNFEMGRLAVRRVVELMQGTDRIITKTQVCTTFVERDTVKDCDNL